MATRHPTVLILAEARSRAGLEDPPILGVHTAHSAARQWQDGGTFPCVCPFGDHHQATPFWGHEDANALLMEVLPLWESIMCWRPMPRKSTSTTSPMSGGWQRYGARLPVWLTR